MSSGKEKALVTILSTLIVSPYITQYILDKRPDPLVQDFLSQYKKHSSSSSSSSDAKSPQQQQQQSQITIPYTPIYQHIRREGGVGDANIEFEANLSSDSISTEQRGRNNVQNFNFKANQSHFIWFYDKESMKCNGQPIPRTIADKFEPYDDKYYDQALVAVNEMAKDVGKYSLLGLSLWFLWTGIRGRRMPSFLQQRFASLQKQRNNKSSSSSI